MSKKTGKVLRAPKRRRGSKSHIETWEKQQGANNPRKLTREEARLHPGYDGTYQGRPDPH